MHRPRNRTEAGPRPQLGLELLEERCVLSTVTLGAVADTYTRAGVDAGSNQILDLYNFPGGGDWSAYVRFDLSGLNIDQITDATLTYHKTTGGTRNDFVVPDRFDVYGLTDQAGNTAQDWNEATLAEGGIGAEYTDVGGDALQFSRLFSLNQESGAQVTESTNQGGGPQSITGADLVAFLQGRADANGLATFITHVDAGSSGRGYAFGARENADPALRPTLQITFDESAGGQDPYPENPVVLPRQMEDLNRGLIAMRRAAGEVYLGWRLLGNDAADVAFNVYRVAGGGGGGFAPAPTIASAPVGGVKLNASPLSASTNFIDTTANLSVQNTYYVAPVVNGVEGELSEAFVLGANAPLRQYLNVPLEIPDPIQFDGETWHYTANDASVGDLDGDGDYEIVLKWTADPTNPVDGKNYLFSPSPAMIVDAYQMDGQLLWRIDVGVNIKTIASSLQFIVYDLDGDGRSEVAMNTADGTTSYHVSGTVGNYSFTQNDVVGNPAAQWTSSDGWVRSGPEYLTIFDGLTGDVLVSTDLQPARGDVNDWGDGYGHRSTTHKYVVAYLDGQRPSLVTGRGIYHGQVGVSKTSLVAWNWRDGALTQQWQFVATEGVPGAVNPDYVGQGNQAVSVADVDGDGFDEIIWGAMVVDHDGAGQHTTGRGHGDALHVADMDPDNPGLEIFEPHESPSEYGDAGGDYRDAMTGELLIAIPGGGDVGRGVAFDIDPNYPGYEMWTSTGEPGTGRVGIYNVQQGRIYDAPGLSQGGYMFMNFGVWWDADPLRELLDGTTIAKWNFNTLGRNNLVWYAASGINDNAPGGADVNVASNNGTKSTPALSGDILGDWREEVIWRTADNSALQIWSTTIETDMRLPTLMHDLQYREAIAWQNVYYNQPPHPSYFIGAGMGEAPRPPLFFGGELAGDYNRDDRVDSIDFAVWREAMATGDLRADGDHSGAVDDGDYDVWLNNYGAVRTPSPATPPLQAPSAPVEQGPTRAAVQLLLGSPASGTPDETQPAYTAAPAPSGLPADALLLYHAARSLADAGGDQAPANATNAATRSYADDAASEVYDEAFAGLDAQPAWGRPAR